MPCLAILCGPIIVRLLRYKPEVPNFGDDLNERLWPALAPALFGTGAGDSGHGDSFVGIGTIVGIDPGASRRLHVFSSGAGYTAADRWDGLDVQYHCVRGPVTARVLGLSENAPLTDGAILAPLIADFRQTKGEGGGRTVIVPHFETIAFPGWERTAVNSGFDLVDPRGTPEAVISALAGAQLVLTESLHGAIIADAYGVPWRGFAVSGNFSIAKWTDWTASMNIDAEVALVPPPDPMPLLRYGKREEQFGAMVQLDVEAALGEFKARIGPAAHVSFLKSKGKRILTESRLARRLMGFSPERTAAALVGLAARDPYLSRATLRDDLREKMLDRLDALVRNHCGHSVNVMRSLTAD